MQAILDLWLPILLTTIGTFLFSFVTWALLPFHNADFQGLPDEDGFLSWLRNKSPRAGMYCFPKVDLNEMKDPAKKERYTQGPHGVMTIWPGVPSMGRNMALTVLFFFVAAIFIAYITAEARAFGSDFASVFQIAATVGVMTFCFASIPNAIWFGKPSRAIVLDLIDGIVYAVIAGVAFAALWPSGGVNPIAGQ